MDSYGHVLKIVSEASAIHMVILVRGVGLEPTKA